MKAIKCERCKIPLGELASGTRIKTGTVHLCANCGKLIIAEAFAQKKDDLMSQFADLMGMRR